MRIPFTGDIVRTTTDLGTVDEDEIEVELPEGTRMRIISTEVLPNSQGLQYLLAPVDRQGLCPIYLDQDDLIDGEYPFELEAP